MQINLRALLGLQVVTESGTRIGKLTDVVLQTDTHAVATYVVRARLFGGREFLIKPAQVKKILADRLVVEDAALASAVPEQKISLAIQRQPGLSGVATRSE